MNVKLFLDDHAQKLHLFFFVRFRSPSTLSYFFSLFFERKENSSVCCYFFQSSHWSVLYPLQLFTPTQYCTSTRNLWCRIHKSKFQSSQTVLPYIYFTKRHVITHQTSICDKMASSLLTIPVELVYRILDNVCERTIFLSLRNVCKRLNTIIDTYHRYQVNSSFISEVRFSSSSTCRSFNNESYFQLHSLFSFILDRMG
jgi:hypothetical protein